MIKQESELFQYNKIQLSYNPDKYNKFEKIINNLTYFLYENEKSSTYKSHDDYYIIDSAQFYFKNINKNETKINMKFKEHANKYKFKYGIIGFQNTINPDYNT